MAVILPVVADLLASALAWVLVPWFGLSLQTRNTGAALVLAAATLLYFVAVHLLKKLKLQPEGFIWQGLAPWLKEERQRVLAFCFSIFLTWALVEQSGFFRTITQVDLGDTGLSYYLLLGPLWWVVLAFLYMFVLSAPTDTTLEWNRGRDLGLIFLSLMATNLMMSMLAGYLAAAPYLDNVPSSYQTWLTIPLFALLFLPPRLLYLFKSRTPPYSLVTFCLVVVVNALLPGF